MRSRTKLLSLISLCFPATLALAADDEVGQVKTASGQVTIERAVAAERYVALSALPGTPVNRSDRIITLKGSTAGIVFDDNSVLTVGPDSVLEIAQFSFGEAGSKDGFETRLERGTLSAISGKIAKTGADAMRVRTPNTVLGVRGTEFLVRVD